MSSNKSSEEVPGNHKKGRKYDSTISSTSSSPRKKLVSPMEPNLYVIEPVPSTTIKVCTSDEDIEVLVFESSTSSSQSNVDIDNSTSKSSSAINLAIEEFQSTLSFLKNKIGLPTPNIDVTGNNAANVEEATSLVPTILSTSKQISDATFGSSVINDSFVSDDSKPSPIIQSLSTKQSSILKRSSSSKQSKPSSSPIPSKVQKLEITTQKVEPRTVELTISLPVNVNCKGNDNSPVAVQTATQLKLESEKKLHHVSENSSSSFKSLGMDSGLENFETHNLQAKTKKIVTSPALSREGRNHSPAEQVSESNDSSTTEQFDKYLKKLRELFKTKKIKSKTKKKYMKSLLEEISKVELSDESSTAPYSQEPGSSKTEKSDWSKNSSLTKSDSQKQLRKKDINEVRPRLPTDNVQLSAKKKPSTYEATEILDSSKEDETPDTFETDSKETYALASSGSNRSLEKESDCILKIAESERNYQLRWINNELNHLHKLKDELEMKNKNSSNKRTKTNVYNIAESDGSSERTYVIKTNVDVLADASINNYVLDGKEYVVSHSITQLSSDSDQAIAAETVPFDGTGMLCKKCRNFICICPSKTTLQSKLSSLCTESKLCLHCQQIVCVCQQKPADSPSCPSLPRLVCICHKKEGLTNSSSAKKPPNKFNDVEAKQLVASKKESIKGLPDFHLFSGDYHFLSKKPSTTEIFGDKNFLSSKIYPSSKERLVLADAKALQKSTQTETHKLSSSRDSNESLIKKIVTSVLDKCGDKKNTEEKSPAKSSSTQAIKISDVALQTSKDDSRKNFQIETDESLSTRALKDSLPQQEENKFPEKSSQIKPKNKLDDMSNNHKSFTGKLPKDQVSSLLDTSPLTEQDLNSLADLSEFDNDDAENALPSLEGNLSSGRFDSENISDKHSKEHKSTQTQISLDTGATQTYKTDEDFGSCVCSKNSALKDTSILPKLNEDFKNELAQMLKELKKIDTDAEQRPATHEKSSGKSLVEEEIVVLKDHKTTYRDIGVQIYPNLSTAQTSIEKLMKNQHVNTDSIKYRETSVQTSPGFYVSSPQPLDKLTNDKNENTDLQFVEPIKNTNAYSDIGVQVYPNLSIATAQTSIEKLMKNQHVNTDSIKYRETSVQTSPRFYVSSPQPLDKLTNDKNENTDLQFVEPVKNPNTYKDIGVQVSSSFYVPRVESSDKLETNRNKSSDSKKPPVIEPNPHRNAGVQASPSYHTAAAQTLNKVEKNEENTGPKNIQSLKDRDTYRDILAEVSPPHHTAQNLGKSKKNKNENTYNFRDSLPRNVRVQASPISNAASAQTLDEVRRNENKASQFNDLNDAVPLKGPSTYSDFGVEVSPSFHTPINSNMDEFEHENSSIATKETCSKCKQCELKKRHRRSKKTMSDSITTITTSFSDSTASPTSRITCSCCKQKAFLAEANYMQNGKKLWAVCCRCFYNRRLYCGFDCRSVCQCWSYWRNTSRNYYNQCCKMDNNSTSPGKFQGIAYTVTLLNNDDAPELQDFSSSNLEDVIKVQKGWTPSHLKYLKNQENNDRRIMENIENKNKKEKAKNKKISKTEITDENKYDEMQQGKPKNISKDNITHSNNKYANDDNKSSKNETSKTDTDNENTRDEGEDFKNEDQDESSEVQSVQNTLMDYLIQNRPEFISAAEYRRQMLLKSQKSREQQKEAKKLNFLENNLKQPNKGKFKLFTEQEMRNINKKNYHKLPEVRGRILNQRENKLRHADRLMSNLLAKKIQKSVLNGKGRFPLDQSLTNL